MKAKSKIGGFTPLSGQIVKGNLIIGLELIR